MILPIVPGAYTPTIETERNRQIAMADQMNRKKMQDVAVEAGARLILVSPNGTRYSVTVDNSGALSAVAV